MIRCMEMKNFVLIRDKFIKDSLYVIKEETERLFGLMDRIIRGIGKMVSLMELVNVSFLMESFIKELAK